MSVFESLAETKSDAVGKSVDVTFDGTSVGESDDVTFDGKSLLGKSVDVIVDGASVENQMMLQLIVHL